MIPHDTLLGEIKKIVSTLTVADIGAKNNVPTPHPGRIWDDIAQWVSDTWPELKVTKESIEEGMKVLQKYMSSRQSRHKATGDGNRSSELVQRDISVESHSKDSQEEEEEDDASSSQSEASSASSSQSEASSASSSQSEASSASSNQSEALSISSPKPRRGNLRPNPKKTDKLNLNEKVTDDYDGNGFEESYSDQEDEESNEELSSPTKSKGDGSNNNLTKFAKSLLATANDPMALFEVCMHYLSSIDAQFLVEANKLVAMRLKEKSVKLRHYVSVEVRDSIESDSQNSDDVESLASPTKPKKKRTTIDSQSSDADEPPASPTKSKKKRAIVVELDENSDRSFQEPKKPKKSKAQPKKNEISELKMLLDEDDVNDKGKADDKAKEKGAGTKDKENTDADDMEIEDAPAVAFGLLLAELKVEETSKEFFLELHERTHFQSEYFIAVHETLQSDAVKEFSLFNKVNVEAIPKPFLRSWLDPTLAGADKEAMLNWVALTLEDTLPQQAKLKIKVKLVMFVLCTVLHSWSCNITAELANRSEFGSKNTSALSQAVNSALFDKLVKHPMFIKLERLGCFPRRLVGVKAPKQAFRTCKSDMFKFLEICRLIPALLFCDIPYSSLIKRAPTTSTLEKSWSVIKADCRSPTYLHASYFSAWTLDKELPPYLLG